MKLTAGCRHIELFDERMAMPFPVLVFYPINVPEAREKLGSFTLNVSRNGPVASGSFPLVVISHGTGGSHLSHRTLAAHLARNGYVVALPEHTRNNRNNNDLAGTEAILEHRPRQMMDRAFSSDVFGPSLKADTAAIIGHALGGYTALATAGGHPTAFPWETEDQQSRPVVVKRDDRVRAVVLLAPAAAWYLSRDSPRDVRIPVLMLTGEKDEICEVPGQKTLPDGRQIFMPEGHSAIIKRGIPDKSPVTHRIVGNAGHFSFITPYREAMINPAFPP
jgi:predicted dienelactone hydrolase